MAQKCFFFPAVDFRLFVLFVKCGHSSYAGCGHTRILNSSRLSYLAGSITKMLHGTETPAIVADSDTVVLLVPNYVVLVLEHLNIT